MSTVDVESLRLGEALLSRMGKLVPAWADGVAARVIEPSSDQTVIVRTFELQCHDASALGAGAGPAVWDDWEDDFQGVIDRDDFLGWFNQLVYRA